MHNRRSIRLKDYDYKSPGAYYVTFLVKHRAPLLSSIVDDQVILSDLGKIAHKKWLWLAEQYPYVELDEYVFMPDHMHAIIWIRDIGGASPEIAAALEGDTGLDLVRAVRERPLPGQSTSGQSTSGQSTSGQSTSGQSTSGQSTSGQSTPGQSTPGQSTPGQSTSGQYTLGQSAPDLDPLQEAPEISAAPARAADLVRAVRERPLATTAALASSSSPDGSLIKIKPLGRLIGAYKTVSTKEMNLLLGQPGEVFWHRNYFESIGRNSEHLERVRKYIRNNPKRYAKR